MTGNVFLYLESGLWFVLALSIIILDCPLNGRKDDAALNIIGTHNKTYGTVGAFLFGNPQTIASYNS